MGKRRRRREIEVTPVESATPVEPVDDRKDEKRDYKLSKIDAKSNKSLATAAKRNSLSRLIKWFLIALAVFYFGGKALISGGGLDVGGWIESAKEGIGGWFGGGN